MITSLMSKVNGISDVYEKEIKTIVWLNDKIKQNKILIKNGGIKSDIAKLYKNVNRVIVSPVNDDTSVEAKLIELKDKCGWLSNEKLSLFRQISKLPNTARKQWLFIINLIIKNDSLLESVEQMWLIDNSWRNNNWDWNYTLISLSKENLIFSHVNLDMTYRQIRYNNWNPKQQSSGMSYYRVCATTWIILNNIVEEQEKKLYEDMKVKYMSKGEFKESFNANQVNEYNRFKKDNGNWPEGLMTLRYLRNTITHCNSFENNRKLSIITQTVTFLSYLSIVTKDKVDNHEILQKFIGFKDNIEGISEGIGLPEWFQRTPTDISKLSCKTDNFYKFIKWEIFREKESYTIINKVFSSLLDYIMT